MERNSSVWSWKKADFVDSDKKLGLLSPAATGKYEYNNLTSTKDSAKKQTTNMGQHSWDIRDQTRKLSKIAPNFEHFLSSQIL